MIPTSAVQRGPLGTFSYVIGSDDIVTAKPVTVTQQDEKDAVIAKGIAPTDRVVTTGFANLSDGAKVTVSQNDQAPTADLPRASGRVNAAIIKAAATASGAASGRGKSKAVGWRGAGERAVERYPRSQP